MVLVEPLKNHIPQSDQRAKEPLIEVGVLQGRQLEQGAQGQKAEEKAQELGRREGWARAGVFWFPGVFLEDV
jgi:hypothetical protein